MAKNSIWKSISYALVLIILGVAVYMIIYFTNGFTSDFKTFYLTVEGKDVLERASGYTVSKDEPLKVEVKYSFGRITGDNKGYSVKVTPNAADGKDFDYSVEGMTYSFQAEADMSAGFNIDKHEGFFTITPRGETLTEVLSAVCSEKEVTVNDGAVYEDMFCVIVTSYNEASTVKLYFTVSKKAFVSLDREVIVF